MKAQPGTAMKQAAPMAQDGLPVPRRYAAAIAIGLGTILTTISGPMVTVALPTLSRELHVDPSAAVLVVTVYQLVLMMALLPFSALGDRIGHRTVYQYGQLVFVTATLLSFFAHSLPFLLVVRAFQAAGAAAALSVSSALVRSVYPSATLGRSLSFHTVIGASVASIAPTVGGAILAVARWPWLFAVLVPFGLLSILIGHKALPDPVKRNDPYDVLGAVMCAAMFGFGVTGLETAVHGDSPIISAALVALGITLGVIFVRREMGQPMPVLPVDLLRQASIALPSLGLLAGYIGSTMVSLLLPFQLQQEFHWSPVETGAVLAAWPLVVMFVAPVAGILSDRMSGGLLGAIGMTFGATGIASLAFLPAAPDHFDMIWRIGLCGFGFGLYQPPSSRQIVFSAPIERSAAAGALMTTTRGTAQTLGATAVAALLASGIGTGSTAPLIAAGLAVIAGICSILAYKPAIKRATILDLPEL
jgi:DHA2 family multidrug resistance protein-like MFS transporter